MYPVVFIGFFGVVRFVPDFFALDRGFLTPPFETVLGVLGVLGVRGAAFPFAVFVEAVGADFFPPVGVFASAARVVARFVGATFFFLLFVRAGFFAMTIRVGVDGGEARCGVVRALGTGWRTAPLREPSGKTPRRGRRVGRPTRRVRCGMLQSVV